MDFASYWNATLAALLAGLVFTLAHPLFHGVGGKLVVFGACLGIYGVLRFVDVFQRTRYGYRPPAAETT